MSAAGADIRRVLVIRRKGLGDALVTLPAIWQLAAAFPRAQLDLVIDRPFAPLLQGLARDLTVIAWPPPPGVSWLMRLLTTGYDLVLDYLGSPRTAVWTALTGAPLRVGYDLSYRRWAYNLRVARNRHGRHRIMQFAGEAFLDPLRSLGMAPPPWRAPGGGQTPLSAELLDGALGQEYRRWDAAWPANDRPRIALMFSASWPAKAWPAREAANLYHQLVADGCDPVLVCGPGDEQLAADLRVTAPRARFAPPTTLVELAHLISRCVVFVGTDSGPRHLAALLGVPTVTVFGPTNPRGWNPDDPRHVAVTRDVPCAPCELTRCPVAGHPCLDDLRAETVAVAVRNLLDQLGGPASGRPKESA